MKRFLPLLFITFSIFAAMDQAANFSRVTVSTGYNASDTTIIVTAGKGAKLPQTPPYNLVWYESSIYPDPCDDPKVEIVRVTNINVDTLTITRAQESTTASTKNNVGSTYSVTRSITAKEFNTDLPGTFASLATSNTFLGANTLPAPILTGTVSIADPTTPAISLASGKTNTGYITINGKTSGSFKLTTADATAQALTLSVAAQTTGNATVSIADMGGTSRTLVTAPASGALTFSGPTAARIITIDDAAQTLAIRNAGQTFTGVQVLTSPSLLGTVSVADTTTPAISLASGSTNTGNITINGKTSGALKLTTVDATAQTLTLSVAAQTTGNATVSIADMGGTSRTFVTAPSAGALSFAGPTAARIITIDDAAQTLARRDIGQTFTGVQVLTSPSLLGTVSVADTTTPAISLATGKTNTGNITINGKTSGSLILTTADATAQAVTFNVAAQSTGAATVSIADMGGTSRTFVTGPSAGALSFTGSTAARIKTIRDAADTILELGGSYTPTGTWTSLTLVTPALGTAASGNVSACTDASAITVVPTMTGGWTELKVTGSDATTTGQSLVDITGLVTGTISTASSYEFQAVLYCTTTAVTTGCEYGIHVTQAPTNISAVYSGPTTVASNIQTGIVSGTNADNIASAAFLTTASEDGTIYIVGRFTTGAGAGPVFSIRHLKVTSGTSTVKIGSVLRFKKL